MSTSGAAPAPILTDAELKLLQALIYQECGMHFDERRTHFLQDRLLRRLKECRADSFYAYYRLLISQQGKDELAKLLENLTVNETSFFRHRDELVGGNASQLGVIPGEQNFQSIQFSIYGDDGLKEQFELALLERTP